MDRMFVFGLSISAFVVLCIVGLIVYGCLDSTQKYYDMEHDCINHGGSFIPIEGNDKAICLDPNGVVKQ